MAEFKAFNKDNLLTPYERLRFMGYIQSASKIWGTGRFDLMIDLLKLSTDEKRLMLSYAKGAAMNHRDEKGPDD